jgi:hypothetical protein
VLLEVSGNVLPEQSILVLWRSGATDWMLLR